METSTPQPPASLTTHRHVVRDTSGSSSNIGFDTVSLSIDHFEVTSDQDLRIDLGEQRHRRHLFKVGERAVEGKRAFYVDDTTGIRIEIINDSRAIVQFSARAINTSNYHLLDASGLRAAAPVVEHVLKEAGVHLTVGDARVCRLDMALDLLTNDTTGTAVDGIAALRHYMDPPRMVLKKDHVGSVLWANSRRAFAVYDKLAQMQNRGLDVAGIPPKLRLEYRIFKAKTVRKDAAIYRLDQLFDQKRHNDAVVAILETIAHDLLPSTTSMTRISRLQRTGWTEALLQAQANSPNAMWSSLSWGMLAAHIASTGDMQTFLAAVENLFGRNRSRWVRRKLLEVDKVGISMDGIHRTLRARYDALRYQVISTAWSKFRDDDREPINHRVFRPVPQWAIPYSITQQRQ